MCANTLTDSRFGFLVLNLTLSWFFFFFFFLTEQLTFLDCSSKLKGYRKTTVTMKFTPHSRSDHTQLFREGPERLLAGPRSWQLHSPVLLSTLPSSNHALQPAPECPHSEDAVLCPWAEVEAKMEGSETCVAT